MIILHNHLSKESRDFVAANGAGNVVISWYEGGRELFESIGGHKKISSFPSVVLHQPAYRSVVLNEDNLVISTHDHPASHNIIREPKNMTDVDAEISKVNALLTISSAHGFNVGALNRVSGLGRSDAYWHSQGA
tara:strand:+ start:201 stop:602 length:402 start_codon:yes stop_codon:yes gene_type:complete